MEKFKIKKKNNRQSTVINNSNNMGMTMNLSLERLNEDPKRLFEDHCEVKGIINIERNRMLTDKHKIQKKL